MGQYGDAYTAVHNFVNSEFVYGLTIMREALAKAKDAEVYVESQVAEVEARRTALATEVEGFEARLVILRDAEVAAQASAAQRALDMDARFASLERERMAGITRKAEQEQARVDAEIAARRAELDRATRDLADAQRAVSDEVTWLTGLKDKAAKLEAAITTLRAERRKLATAALEDE